MGLSLVEMIVSVALIGLAVVSILGALGASLRASAQLRKHATADAMLRNTAQSIIGAATGYVTCATASSYSSVVPTDPRGGSAVTIRSMEYWNGAESARFTSSCSPDNGAQRITIEARSNDGRVVESLQFVKRRLTDGLSTTVSPALSMLGAGSNVLTVSGGGKMAITGDASVKTNSDKWAEVLGTTLLQITGATQLGAGDPHAALPIPTAAGLPIHTGVYSGPGIYRTLPLTIATNTTMAPGTYILEAGMIIRAGTVTGSDVFLFNGCATGSAATCSNAGAISILAPSTVRLSAPTSGPYGGILLFQHRTNSSPVSISSTAGHTLDGSVYASGATVSMIGIDNATVSIGGVVADTMTVVRTGETQIGRSE